MSRFVRRTAALTLAACVGGAAAVVGGDQNPNAVTSLRFPTVMRGGVFDVDKTGLGPGPVPGLVASGRGRHRLAALTFDDGPGPFTAGIVVALRRLRVPATFFQVGQMIRAFPKVERMLVRTPRMVLGDHTESHAPLKQLSPRKQAYELEAAAVRIRRAGAPRPTLMRPPYGLFDLRTLRVADRAGMTVVLWSIDSRDYALPGVRRIVRRVVSQAAPGSIVLMHDAGGDRSQTRGALPLIVKRLRARGFRFVTVPELLRIDPPRYVECRIKTRCLMPQPPGLRASGARAGASALP